MNGFKKTILAATAAFALGIAANAQAFLIDDFSQDQVEVSDLIDGGPTSDAGSALVSGTDLAGATRTITTETTANTAGGLTRGRVQGGFYNHSQDAPNSSGRSQVDWTGFASADVTANGDVGLAVTVIFADQVGSFVTLALTDGNGATGSTTFNVPIVAFGTPQAFLVTFGALGVDTSDIRAVSLIVDGTAGTALDVSIDLVNTPNTTVPEPGTMMLMGGGLLGLGLWRRFKK